MRPLLLLLAAATPLSAQIDLQIKDQTLNVTIDGELFTQYRTDQRVPCLYPLRSASGGNLTRNYPLSDATPGEKEDHPHHVSMWMTHGLVNGVDFWAQHLKRKGKIIHKTFGPVTKNSFTVTLSWEEGDTVHLTEKRTYTFSTSNNTRIIDVTSVLSNDNNDVLFGDTKEGTFALRLTPTMRLKGEVAKGSILNSNGQTDGDCWGKRAAWVAYSGPDSAGKPAVVAIFDHPSNLRHPCWWHARDYGLVAANPFGQHHFERKKDAHLGDYKLTKGESLTLRHRVLLHHGSTESAQLEQTFKQFSKTQ